MKSLSHLLLLATALVGTFASPVDVETELVERQTEITCTYKQRNPRLPLKKCGDYGTLKKPSKLGGPTTKSSVGLCRDACFDTPRCLSFSYNPTAQTCQLFNKLVIKMGFKKAESGDVQYYNHACFRKKCTTPPAEQCSNQGVEYAAFPLAQNLTIDTLTEFDPEVYKTAMPYYTSLIQGPGGISGYADPNETDPRGNIYGADSDIPISKFAVNHRTYFYTLLSGAYTFTIYNTDDVAEFWFVDNVVSGYSRDNFKFQSYYSFDSNQNAQTGTKSYSVALQAGKYYPLRIVFGQIGGPYNLQFKIQDPNLDVIYDSANQIDPRNPPDFYTSSCDGTSAPAFEQRFGEET